MEITILNEQFGSVDYLNHTAYIIIITNTKKVGGIGRKISGVQGKPHYKVSPRLAWTTQWETLFQKQESKQSRPKPSYYFRNVILTQSWHSQFSSLEQYS